ncbi:hypothetical protein Huta_2649 [Halorhabdus utahensis DSM 12940]|uniref:Uncharacterized protein n=2 Tax=Halorhabdus utahensis TaxID=146826 RepID=C7NQ84_HALUD|nr:hypothetical protein Huta_2649 [Halorhabdus utahensis DSM 12940]
MPEYRLKRLNLDNHTTMHEIAHSYCVGLDDEGVDMNKCLMENETDSQVWTRTVTATGTAGSAFTMSDIQIL